MSCWSYCTSSECRATADGVCLPEPTDKDVLLGQITCEVCGTINYPFDDFDKEAALDRTFERIDKLERIVKSCVKKIAKLEGSKDG